jgi:hypothetical protein
MKINNNDVLNNDSITRLALMILISAKDKMIKISYEKFKIESNDISNSITELRRIYKLSELNDSDYCTHINDIPIDQIILPDLLKTIGKLHVYSLSELKEMAAMATKTI